MNLDLIALKSFLSIAELGNFTKAAKQVGRTQSAVSQQISRLESEIGKPLFIRGKSLKLTEVGEIVLRYARQVSSLHREILDQIQRPDLEGEIRFGLPEDFATIYLREILSEFIHIHPRIQLRVECDLTLNLLERFKQKEFDLVLLKMGCIEDFPNGQPIWKEPLEWIGSTQEIDVHGPIPLVLSPHPCVYRTRTLDALESMRQAWKVVFTSPSFSGKIAAVKAGMGISVMPRNMIPKDIEILRDPCLPQLDNTHISLLRLREDSSEINTFSEFVIRKLQQY